MQKWQTRGVDGVQAHSRVSMMNRPPTRESGMLEYYSAGKAGPSNFAQQATSGKQVSLTWDQSPRLLSDCRPKSYVDDKDEVQDEDAEGAGYIRLYKPTVMARALRRSADARDAAGPATFFLRKALFIPTAVYAWPASARSSSPKATGIVPVHLPTAGLFSLSPFSPSRKSLPYLNPTPSCIVCCP